MTTQVRKGMKAKVDALADALTEVAREAQPRPGFFVEPLLRVWEQADPEGERQAHEVFYFVVDGSEEELRIFDKKIGAAFAYQTTSHPVLRAALGIEIILVNEAASVVRP